MSKIDIDMTKIKEELKNQMINLSEEKEPEKLQLLQAQFFRMEGKLVFVHVLEDINGKKYQYRVSAESQYEDQIKKSLSRLRSIPIPKEQKQEGKKDDKTVVETPKS